MKKYILSIALSFIWFAALGEELTQDVLDYKADFIIKAVNYVTWPEGTDVNSDGAVIIAVVGESPLTAKLTELAVKKTSEGTKMAVVTKSIQDDLTACQVLFIATDDKASLAKILKKLKLSPVLTISDTEYFARYGVMVNFYKDVDDDENVKFEVNTMTLAIVGLKMSSKLLKMATLI